MEVDNKTREELWTAYDELTIRDNNLYLKQKNDYGEDIYRYVVQNAKQIEVLEQLHNSIIGGHLGRDLTLRRAMTRVYWPFMNRDIKKHVQHCIQCQKIKKGIRNKAKLISIKPSKPGELITSDIAGPFPKTKNENEYIIVIIDHFSKWTRFYPLKTMEAKDVAKRIVEYMFTHGIPEKILTDCGANYQSFLMAEIHDLLDVVKLKTTPFHPEADGIS